MNDPKRDDEVIRFLSSQERTESATPPLRQNQVRAPSIAAAYRRKVQAAQAAGGAFVLGLVLFLGLRVGMRALRAWDRSHANNPPANFVTGDQLQEALDREKLRHAIESAGNANVPELDLDVPATGGFDTGGKFDRALQEGNRQTEDEGALDAHPAEE
jgi:hypothetical protein